MTEADSRLDLNDSRAPAPGRHSVDCQRSVRGSRGLGKAGPLPGQEQIVCSASVEGCDLGGEDPLGRWDGVFVGGPEST